MTNAPASRPPASPAGGSPTTRRRAGVAVGCCGLVLAALVGCAATRPAGSASTQPAASPSSPAAATDVSGADLKALAASYLKIADPANHRLDVEVDGYGDAELDSLASAEKYLRAEVATERGFDAQLLSIRFPSWIAMTARALVTSNQLRIALTERQARSASLTSLRSLDHRHKAADSAVEDQVRLIRQFLGLPPPSAS